ncbi:hypothetical protein [Asaia sp. HN128]|uniref:hypothetical protein n=1 Tax=Asaia sp. HN128 TaxID=3081234 RepID=UPI0026848345
MTPAQQKAEHAEMALAYLRNAAWGLNRTPHAARLIGDWERVKNGAATMIIPAMKETRS